MAVTRLKAGECVEEHAHDTMEEIFFVLDGEQRMSIDRHETACTENDFIHIKARTRHGLKAMSDVRLMTVGCAVKKNAEK